jgi:archaeosine synthase
MEFNVTHRDGPARIGEFIVDDKKGITPNILFIHTQRFKTPDFAELLITNTNRKNGKPTVHVHGSVFPSSDTAREGKSYISNNLVYPKDLPKNMHIAAIKQSKKQGKLWHVIPGNREVIDEAVKDNDALLFIVAYARQLFMQQSQFVDFVVRLREKIGYPRLIYLPSVGDPMNFALLAYLGVDLFDSTAAIIAARNNFLLFPTGMYHVTVLEENPCSCPSCSKFHGKSLEMTFQQILSHNYFALFNEIKQVRTAIRQGRLRELVESRVRADPGLTAMLRILDFDYDTFLEERTPLTRSSTLLATTKEALFRPEVKRFQERLLSRYHKSKHAKVLLLLPCSAKKPYSFSKSHRLFREQVRMVNNPDVVHEVIITSPLGVVPRELELIYPASSYDIPVTGFWDEDEKTMIRTLLQQYLKHNRYETCILHLPPPLQEFVGDLVPNPIVTCEDHPTSDESLKKLNEALAETINTYKPMNPAQRTKDDMESRASYQFGKQIAKQLLKGCTIKGRYPHQKLIYQGTQLGMLTPERGLLSLTMPGAERLATLGLYWIEISDDFILKGSVFAPGVENADETIRIGDEVVVVQNKKLCAVGVAQMNGTEMTEATHGEAVKIRHHY